MLFGETVAVYCENHREHTDTLCGQKAEYYNMEAAGTYSYRAVFCINAAPFANCIQRPFVPLRLAAKMEPLGATKMQAAFPDWRNEKSGDVLTVSVPS
jgi:hypothetical protein